ncbi:MAG: redoxin domain-containing protein [Planctomycetes bacterium]|nr:redoxin domain-containing protein [Planctomycetota bacterium]
MFRITTIAAAALALSIAGICQAGDEDKTLTIGDKAPGIDITHWLKGEKIDEFEKDKVYVLEFWATWCPPCVAAMPHLSELQEKYRDYDVTFIGVSDEPLQTVFDFMFKEYKGDGKIHNDRTHYTLTTDPDESVKNDFFRAAGQTGIPCTFIIGKSGLIEYIGHPMMMDDALDAVVRDEWDRETFKVGYEEEMKPRRIQSKAFQAMRDEEWDKALGHFDEMIKLDPDDLNARMYKFDLLLTKKKDYEAAYGYAGKLIKKYADNPYVLNNIAWTIVDTEGLEVRNLELALKAAKGCNKQTEFENAAYLDTFARVYYEMGDLKKAIGWQEKAAEVAGDDEMGEGIREVLEKYREEAK